MYKKEGISFSRKHEYMKWRFPKSKGYAIYLCNEELENPIYFVVKSLTWKNINALIVSDYSMCMDENQYLIIIDAIKKIAKKIKRKIILVGSSDGRMNRQLKKKHFYFLNRGPILSNIKFPVNKDLVESDEFSFITYADSDADFNYQENNSESLFKLGIRKLF